MPGEKVLTLTLRLPEGFFSPSHASFAALSGASQRKGAAIPLPFPGASLRAGLWGCWAPSPASAGLCPHLAMAALRLALPQPRLVQEGFVVFCSIAPTQWEQAELDPCLLRAAFISLPGSTEPSPGSGREES